MAIGNQALGVVLPTLAEDRLIAVYSPQRRISGRPPGPVDLTLVQVLQRPVQTLIHSRNVARHVL